MAKDEVTIDELARMVAGGLEGLQNSMNQQFEAVGSRLNNLESSLAQFREENAREHSEMKLRLDNVPYRFELKELEERITKLEKKARFA